MSDTELPMGFGMALARNAEAMRAYEAMTEAEKQAVIQKTHTVGSKQEMRQLVAGLIPQAKE